MKKILSLLAIILGYIFLIKMGSIRPITISSFCGAMEGILIFVLGAIIMPKKFYN